MLLLSSELSGGDGHPDPDERFVDGLQALGLDEKDFSWFVALQGLMLWQDYYRRPISWLSTGTSPKEVFLAAMAFISAAKNR